MSAAVRATALAALLLSACAAPVRQGPAVPQAAAALGQAHREELLAAHGDWSLQGRVAVSNGHNGGSGRIDWRQAGSRYEVALSAPVTRQSWRLSGDATQARLDGLDGGPRQGADAMGVLREATGWVIPVAALASWVRGARAPDGGPAALQFDGAGRLARLQQDGWTIDYSDWQPQPGFGTELPARLAASRDDARVRLVIDHWNPAADAP